MANIALGGQLDAGFVTPPPSAYLDQLQIRLDGAYPLRNQNRKDWKHYEVFPVFDDAECMTARRSSGWKETSRHRRHQYKVA